MNKQGIENDEQLKAWMREFGNLPLDDSPLPDPAFIWWKAELLRRWDAQRRSAAPIEVGELIQTVVGLAGAITLVMYLWRTGLPPSLIVVTLLSVLILIVLAAIALRGLIVGE